MNYKYLFLILFFFALFLPLAGIGGFSFAQENIVSNETSSNQDVGVADIAKVASDIKDAIVPASQEVKEIEKRAIDVKEVIKKKEEKLEEAKSEAQKVTDERIILEKEVHSKKEAAAIARQELEAVREEVAINKNSDAVKRAKELSVKADRLDKEATVAGAKLEKLSSKAEDAKSELDAKEAKIKQLKESLDALNKEKISKRTWIEKGIMASVLIFIGLVLFLFIKLGVKKFEELVTEKGKIRESEMALRVKTLSHLFYWLGTLAIVAIIGYMVLQTFGFDVAPLLAGAGIVGIAFGFGGQYLIRDVINGFFILLEGQFRINDVIKVGEFGGLVENINLRITTLRDLEGRVIIIPNGEIKTVVNFTKEYAQALFDIGVAYKENIDNVMAVIKDLGKQMRKDEYFGKLILDDLEMLGVDDFGDSQVTVKFRIKTLPIKQWEVAREFRRRLKNRFDELGIEIPFPHRTLYFGTGSDNEWLRKFAQKDAPENKI